MLPYHKAQSIQAHKVSQYSNDYDTSSKDSRTQGHLAQILPAIQNWFSRVRAYGSSAPRRV